MEMDPEFETRLKLLSPREIEIVKCLKDGLGTKAIAQKLSISSKTVSKHRSNILSKLDIKSTRELLLNID